MDKVADIVVRELWDVPPTGFTPNVRMFLSILLLITYQAVSSSKSIHSRPPFPIEIMAAAVAPPLERATWTRRDDDPGELTYYKC